MHTNPVVVEQLEDERFFTTLRMSGQRAVREPDAPFLCDLVDDAARDDDTTPSDSQPHEHHDIPRGTRCRRDHLEAGSRVHLPCHQRIGSVGEDPAAVADDFRAPNVVVTRGQRPGRGTDLGVSQWLDAETLKASPIACRRQVAKAWVMSRPQISQVGRVVGNPAASQELLLHAPVTPEDSRGEGTGAGASTSSSPHTEH